MTPKLLQLVAYENPILRKKTTPVKFPLSQADLDIIANMLFSIQTEQLIAADASFTQAAGMAANQWGIDKSIFLFCPEGNDTGYIEVIINPSYTAIDEQDENWEGCFSVPNSSGKVKRFLKIKVEYQDQAGRTIAKELSGWPARVWQHENDHLNGFLFDDSKAGKCLEKLNFSTEQELEDFYQQVRNERKQNTD